MNADAYLHERRTALFSFEKTLTDQCRRHYRRECHCLKKQKCCRFEGTIDLSRFGDSSYIHEILPQLETLYHVFQSTTQSLRCRTGMDFETIVRELLDARRIPYARQVYISEGNQTVSFRHKKGAHPVDFIIPIPNEGDHASGYEIISCKTRLRERHLQDRFLRVPYTLISLEALPPCPRPHTIRNIAVLPDDSQLELYLDDLNRRYPDTTTDLMMPMTATASATECLPPLRVLDLFCGCGGFSQGLTDAGLDVLLGIDIWDRAIETYTQNMPHPGLCRDLTVFSPEECATHLSSPVDVIVGGPPCQSFSMAGRRDKNDPRGSLFMEYVRYISFFKPKAFLFENVVGILSQTTAGGEKVIDIILGLLSQDYECVCEAMYASDYEVPQNRRRVIILGIRRDLAWSIPPSLPPIVSTRRIPVSTVLLPYAEADKTLFLSLKALDGIRRKRDRMKSEGKGFGAQFLDPTRPSFTIPSRYWKDGYDALVRYSDTEVRRLSIPEIQKIQTFPDGYRLSGSKKEQIIQLGNAVACRFAYHLGLHLRKLFGR